MIILHNTILFKIINIYDNRPTTQHIYFITILLSILFKIINIYDNTTQHVYFITI